MAREAPLFRIYALAYEPEFWGRTGKYRFDAPGKDYGVLYTADTFDGAFIETFGRVATKLVTVDDFASCGVAIVELRRALRLVDLAGSGLSRLRLDTRICLGERELAQQWSYALWAHPSQPDGIWYAARHDAGQRSVALFERCSAFVTVKGAGALRDAPYAALTEHAMKKYHFAVVDE